VAAQIHIAGSTWIRVSRQFVNSSFTPTKSIAKAPTARARGASHGRAWLSRMIMSSTVAWSLSRTALANRATYALAVRRCRAGGWSAGGPPPATGGADRSDAFPSTVTVRLSLTGRRSASPRPDEVISAPAGGEPWSRDQFELPRAPDRLTAMSHGQLAVDASEVGLDCVHREVHLGGYLSCAEQLRQ